MAKLSRQEKQFMEIIETCFGEKATIVVHQPSHGLFMAIIKRLEASKGEWLAKRLVFDYVPVKK